MDKALDILKKYDQVFKNKHEKLLPVFSNQKINKYLKEVAAILKINKKLSFHAARHTFATTVTLSNGVPIETIIEFCRLILIKNKKKHQNMMNIIF